MSPRHAQKSVLIVTNTISIQKELKMLILAVTTVPLAAIGYSMVYLLAGGGFFGAMVIFVVAKMLGK